MNKHLCHIYRYGIISFGEDPTILQRFRENEPSLEKLKQLVQGLPGSQGPPDFEEALEAAKNVFDGEGLRPNALKVGRFYGNLCRCAEKFSLFGNGK